MGEPYLDAARLSGVPLITPLAVRLWRHNAYCMVKGGAVSGMFPQAHIVRRCSTTFTVLSSILLVVGHGQRPPRRNGAGLPRREPFAQGCVQTHTPGVITLITTSPQEG
jgi:hypothetical protein